MFPFLPSNQVNYRKNWISEITFSNMTIIVVARCKFCFFWVLFMGLLWIFELLRIISSLNYLLINCLQGEHLVIANVGDSRAVLATTSDDGHLVPLQLSIDFKPNLPR